MDADDSMFLQQPGSPLPGVNYLYSERFWYKAGWRQAEFPDGVSKSGWVVLRYIEGQ